MTAHLLQKDLFSKRWRKVKRREPLEHQIQIALLEHLRYRVRPGVSYWHIPNGEELVGGARTGAKLKAMGVLPGVADLQFIWAGPSVLFLELKARGRKLRAEQQVFRDRMVGVDCHYEMADNIDDALNILDRYGLLRKR